MYTMLSSTTQEHSSVASLMSHSAIHALSHTWIVLVLLFLIYMIVMKLERTMSTDKIVASKANSPISGGLLGVIPQCGVGVVAADLFNRNKISIGTLLAVFISSSDEALLVLFSGGDKTTEALLMIATKVVLGILFGLFFDKLYKSDLQDDNGLDCHHRHHCECCHVGQSIWKDALKHAAKVTFFVFIVFFFFDFSISLVGQEAVYSVLMTDNIFQPFVAAAIGLIPVCAISIILATLYLSGGLSFGSALAGLISAAGFGLVVLIRGNSNRKIVLKVILSLYTVAVLCGVVCELLF